MTRCNIESEIVSCALLLNLRHAMLQNLRYLFRLLLSYYPTPLSSFSSDIIFIRLAKLLNDYDQVYIMSSTSLVALYLLGHSNTSNLFHSSHEHHILWPHQMCYRYWVCASLHPFMPCSVSLLMFFFGSQLALILCCIMVLLYICQVFLYLIHRLSPTHMLYMQVYGSVFITYFGYWEGWAFLLCNITRGGILPRPLTTTTYGFALM
jgi:hypothetical protein